MLTYGATERNEGRDEATRGLSECARFVRENTNPLLLGMVGLHASFTASDATIEEAGALARELGVGLHIHVSEAASDDADAVVRGYNNVYDRLVKLDAVPPGSLFAHGVHFTAKDVEDAASKGVWFLFNPQSNEGNRVGFASVLVSTDRVALGTDGYPADMPAERAAAEVLLAANGQDVTHAARRAAQSRALVGELFGASFADLEPGAVADVVALGPAGEVVHVVVAGRVVVQDGALVSADFSKIEADARRAAPILWGAMKALQAPPDPAT